MGSSSTMKIALLLITALLITTVVAESSEVRQLDSDVAGTDDCPAGYACNICAAGKAPNSEKTSCDNCAAGKAPNSEKTSCSSCAAGKSSSVGATSSDGCTNCAVGKFAAA